MPKKQKKSIRSGVAERTFRHTDPGTGDLQAAAFYRNGGSNMMETMIICSPQYGAFRAMSDGEQLLVAGSDVAELLGYGNPRAAVHRHCCPLGCEMRKVPDRTGRMQYMKFITPDNLYLLCRAKNNQISRNFASWFSEEIEPRFCRYSVEAEETGNERFSCSLNQEPVRCIRIADPVQGIGTRVSALPKYFELLTREECGQEGGDHHRF